MSHELERDFINALLGDWDRAMDRFFDAVDKERRKRDLTDVQVLDALLVGYGWEVAESWDEWITEMNE